MISRRGTKLIAAMFLLAGILFSPVKAFMLRCWSNPWGWFEIQCEQFRHVHSDWGLVPLTLGLVLMLGIIVTRKGDEE